MSRALRSTSPVNDESLLLASDETILYRSGLHPILYAVPGVLILLTFTAAFLIHATAGPEGSGNAPLGVVLLGGSAAAVMVVGLALRLRSSRFVVTSKRVVFQDGIITLCSVDLLLEQVETLSVTQGILDRYFDFGTIKVVGAGGSREAFTMVRSPRELHKQIRAAADEAKRLTVPS